MNLDLAISDFQRLVDIVVKLPLFHQVSFRHSLINATLAGLSEYADTLSAWNLNGSDEEAAGDIISRFFEYGKVISKNKPLKIFLNYVLSYRNTEDETSEFIRTLFEKYQLGKWVIVNQPIDNWTVSENENTLQSDNAFHLAGIMQDVRVLELASDAANAVVKIESPKGIGTGFMISPDLLLTSSQIIDNPATATLSSFTFGYQLDREGREHEISIASADLDKVFYSNPRLNYTVIQLTNVPPFGKPLWLKRSLPQPRYYASTIQHSGGHHKKILLQRAYVTFSNADIVQYVTNSSPCIPGAPIFNAEFQVIAVHQYGSNHESSNSGISVRNKGTSLKSILSDLKELDDNLTCQNRVLYIRW